MHNAIKLFPLVAIIVFISINTSFAGASSNCTPSQQLKKHAGHYAFKPFWDKLPNSKIWSASGMHSISAIEIDASGNASGIFAWHERGEMCVQLRGTELWANEVLDTGKQPKWVGPYIRIGAASKNESMYFTRIFGEACFKSDNNETWCFGAGSIKVGSKKYAAELIADTSEMPTYGTPVEIKGEKAYWVFVPWKGGWKVFKDIGDLSKPINPQKAKPWRILLP